jgi:hypothetical protein
VAATGCAVARGIRTRTTSPFRSTAPADDSNRATTRTSSAPTIDKSGLGAAAASPTWTWQRDTTPRIDDATTVCSAPRAISTSAGRR